MSSARLGRFVLANSGIIFIPPVQLKYANVFTALITGIFSIGYTIVIFNYKLAHHCSNSASRNGMPLVHKNINTAVKEHQKYRKMGLFYYSLHPNERAHLPLIGEIAFAI